MGECPNLTDPALWSYPSPTGDERMLFDPIARAPFKLNAMPQCIEEDALLFGGIRALMDRGSTVRIVTAYTRHVNEDDLSFGWRGRGFERGVKRADYFGFEAFPRRSEEKPGVRQSAATRHGVDRTGYYNRRGRAIAASGSPLKCFPMDVSGVNSSPLERSIIQAHEALFEDYWDFETYAALCGINNVREWIMLARLGIHLQEREGDKRPRLHIFTLFGRQHQDLTRKARLLGSRCKVIVKDQSDDFLQEARMMETGVVPRSHHERFDEPSDPSD